MEDIILQIYGTFILTLAGFVLPILAITISLFSEGVTALRQIYENEQKQAEGNLKDELVKKETKRENELDLDALTKNITALKLTKKRAEKRLFYLNPLNILSKSAIALGISLVTFLCSLFFYTGQYTILPIALIAVSIGFLVWALIIFSNSIKIIIEASVAVQGIQKTSEGKIFELLTMLVDNSKHGGESLFIKHEEIKVFFDDMEISEGKEYSYSVNNKHDVKISLKNLSEYMLKTAQLGFTFPSEFLIEERANFSIYTSDKEKIVRFKHDYLQSNEHMIEGTVSLTFLKVGIFDVNTFIKGENLKNKSVKFKIKVVE